MTFLSNLLCFHLVVYNLNAQVNIQQGQIYLSNVLWSSVEPLPVPFDHFYIDICV